MGIKRSHPNRNCSINLRILLCCVPVTLFLISSTGYMVLKANSVLEFNDSFYVNVTALLNICSISISIWNMPNIFNVIKQLEKTIAKSKRKPSLCYVTIIVSKEFNEKLSFVPLKTQNWMIQLQMPNITIWMRKWNAFANCIIWWWRNLMLQSCFYPFYLQPQSIISLMIWAMSHTFCHFPCCMFT